MNETLYCWTFNFHKVVRQHDSGAVEDFILLYSAVYLRIQTWNSYWNLSTFAKVIVKIKVAQFFSDSQCSMATLIDDCNWLFHLYRLQCSDILKLLCVALLDDLHLSLECDASAVANNPNPWTENSPGVSMWTENKVEIKLFFVLITNPNPTANLAWSECERRDRCDRQECHETPHRPHCPHRPHRKKELTWRM